MGTKDEPMKLDAKLMIVLTAIIAVATAVNVWVFWYESEDSSHKIQTLSDRAARVVDSMNTALSDNRDAISKAFKENKDAVDASNIQNQQSVRATLKAAADANRTAQEALEAQVRPWITEAAQIGEPIIFNVNGASITFLFTLDNVGHSPADRVWIEGRLINLIFSPLPSIEDQQRVCDGPVTARATFAQGETLFPGKPLLQSVGWTIPWNEIRGTRTPNLLGPLLYGCIEYSYGLSNKRHSTPFRYQVNQADGRMLVQDGGFSTSTGEIPASMLGLRRLGILGQPTTN